MSNEDRIIKLEKLVLESLGKQADLSDEVKRLAAIVRLVNDCVQDVDARVMKLEAGIIRSAANGPELPGC